MRKYLYVLVLAVALAGLNQVASAAASASKSTTSTAPQRVLPDAQIEANIRARLAKSKMAATEHFTVSVHNGVAVLEGRSNVIQHKGVATRLAKSGGALAVQNHIQISDAAKAKAAAGLAKNRTPAGGPVHATVIPASK